MQTVISSCLDSPRSGAYTALMKIGTVKQQLRSRIGGPYPLTLCRVRLVPPGPATPP